MKLLVNKTSALTGRIKIPGSKSHSVRALIIALLSNGRTAIKNFLVSDDTRSAKNLCGALGVNISESDHFLQIDSITNPINKLSSLHSGNSGITTCFILPVLGLRKNHHESVVLDCHDQMRHRPIKPLIKALQNLGMNIAYVNNNEKLPIRVNGSLCGGAVEVDGSNSQYLSALLLSLPCAPNSSVIRVKNLQERPYVAMTLSWLNKYKIKYKHIQEKEWDTYQIPGKQKYEPQLIDIPGDYSSASYAMAAASILPSDVIIQGLDPHDSQGDKRLIEILRQMSADIFVEKNEVHIRGGKLLNGIKVDANDIPDLLPALAVLGACATGKMEIINVAPARIKETDRIESMANGLTQLGAKVETHKEGLTIWKSHLVGNDLHGYYDHRTVMALSVAGLIAKGTTRIDTAESINKTYPLYVESMQQLKSDMQWCDE